MAKKVDAGARVGLSPEQQNRINQFIAAVDAAGLLAVIDNIDLQAATWPPSPVAHWKPEATQTQFDAWAALLAGWSWATRRARTPNAILTDLLTLTAPQRSSIIGDLNSGSPPKYRLSSSPVVWACAPVFRNTSGTTQAEAILAALTFYLIEHPSYLLDTFSINILGDEPTP